jgi:hypothetical protein
VVTDWKPRRSSSPLDSWSPAAPDAGPGECVHFPTLWSDRSEPEGSIKGSTARWRSCKLAPNKKCAFSGQVRHRVFGTCATVFCSLEPVGCVNSIPLQMNTLRGSADLARVRTRSRGRWSPTTQRSGVRSAFGPVSLADEPGLRVGFRADRPKRRRVCEGLGGVRCENSILPEAGYSAERAEIMHLTGFGGQSWKPAEWLQPAPAGRSLAG